MPCPVPRRIGVDEPWADRAVTTAFCTSSLIASCTAAECSAFPRGGPCFFFF